MQRAWDVVVASAHVENRTALIRILERLPVNIISCANLEQVEGVLSQRPIALVFCDERLPDGSYLDVLSTVHTRQGSARVVVLSRVGEWDEYMQASQLGAFDVIRCPFQPPDVELSVIHAMHEEESRASQRMSA